MLTGFNTDVEHQGQVFHVQTQDKGEHDPVVETMVYLGGRILASVSTPYSDLIESAEDLNSDLIERMKGQHLSLINKILSGRFGEASKRDLSELVLDYLEAEIEEAGPEPVEEVTIPDAETRKRRLQSILEHLEAQIEKEREARAAAAVVETVAPRRSPAWIYGAAIAALLAGVVIFAPMMDRMPGEVATPILIEAAPLETAVKEEEPRGVLTAGPAGPSPAASTPTEKRSAPPVEISVTEPVAEPPPPPVPAAPEETELALRVEPPVPLPEPEPAAMMSWQGKLVPYSEVDLAPVPTSRELPSYTRRAWKQRQQGVVRLDLLIDEKGYVSQLKVLEKVPDSDLHEVAMDAAVGWRFTPARKEGQEVKVWKTVAMEFSISPDHEEVVKILE